MRITEKRLRRIIRGVIRESIESKDVKSLTEEEFKNVTIKYDGCHYDEEYGPRISFIINDEDHEFRLENSAKNTAQIKELFESIAYDIADRLELFDKFEIEEESVEEKELLHVISKVIANVKDNRPDESKRRELARFGSDGDITDFNPKFARDIDQAQLSL